jgi:molybdopterin-guanine dinucleotide biosynthesis protein A
MTYDGVVLAGGAGRRLGGVSKPSLVIGDRRLLDIAVGALLGAGTTIVVGESMATQRPVTWTREQPPGGGPVAAIAAALPLVRAASVVVLACDLPWVTGNDVEELVSRQAGAAGALAVDSDGRDQPLLACYSVAALRLALPFDPDGASMRSLLDALRAGGALERVRFDGPRSPTIDCDTPDDLARAQERV